MKIEDFQSEAGEIVASPASEFSDDGWVLPMEHLSVSQLNKFLMCERAYQQSYVVNDKAPASSDQVLGSAVHGAIAFALTHEDWNPADSSGYFTEVAWPNTIEDQEQKDGIEWHDADPEALRFRGAAMVEAYVEKVVPRIELDQIEKRFELHLPAVPVPIVGFIDITQKGTRPAIDIKTSSRAQNTILPSWLLQGRVYQLVEEKPVDWHVVTKQLVPQVLTSVESPALLQTYSEAQSERTRQLVERLAWRINAAYRDHGESEDWDWTGITHTFACNRCHWRGRCPGWEGS